MLGSLPETLTNAYGMGNKQEELGMCVQSQGRDLLAVMVSQYSRDWKGPLENESNLPAKAGSPKLLKYGGITFWWFFLRKTGQQGKVE